MHTYSVLMALVVIWHSGSTFDQQSYLTSSECWDRKKKTIWTCYHVLF